MLLHPCFHLILESLGDVDRPCFAAVLEGQLAAAAALGAKGCGQGRTSRDKFLDPGVPHPPQQSGVFGELHRILLFTKYIYLVSECKKNSDAKKKTFVDGERRLLQHARSCCTKPSATALERCDKSDSSRLGSGFGVLAGLNVA
jgi:hypothetical protein